MLLLKEKSMHLIFQIMMKISSQRQFCLYNIFIPLRLFSAVQVTNALLLSKH